MPVQLRCHFAPLRYTIALKNSRHFLFQSEVKLKPIVTHLLLLTPLFARVFPRFASATCIWRNVLIGSLYCLCLLWLARMTYLVLVLRHCVENALRLVNWGAEQIGGEIHSRNFGLKLNGSVRSNRKSFWKVSPPWGTTFVGWTGPI